MIRIMDFTGQMLYGFVSSFDLDVKRLKVVLPFILEGEEQVDSITLLQAIGQVTLCEHVRIIRTIHLNPAPGQHIAAGKQYSNQDKGGKYYETPFHSFCTSKVFPVG
jgi:hypothetical protein